MTSLPWLDPHLIEFPSTAHALTEPNGLLAVGGDLSPERLICAYQQGIFPWYEDGQPILWWSPSPRAVLYPDKIHISKSLRKTLKKEVFTVTFDTAFEAVIDACAKSPRDGKIGSTWITTEMNRAYNELYNRGIAHSVETWHEGELVGGLYGLAIGKVFFGESMFSKKTDASKVAFAHLAKQLQEWDFVLIDCQVSNPHLTTLGAEEIDRETFENTLRNNSNESTPQHWGRTYRQR